MIKCDNHDHRLKGQPQFELHQPIPWNSVESDLSCTLWIDFDKLTLMLHNLMLTSQKPCNTITVVIAANQVVINEVLFTINIIIAIFY